MKRLFFLLVFLLSVLLYLMTNSCGDDSTPYNTYKLIKFCIVKCYLLGNKRRERVDGVQRGLGCSLFFSFIHLPLSVVFVLSFPPSHYLSPLGVYEDSPFTWNTEEERSVGLGKR